VKRLLNNGARGSHSPAPGEYRGCPNPKCRCVDLATVKVQSKAGERLKVVCGECGRFIRYAKLPWTLERAYAFTLHFGQYRGRTTRELARTREGWRYLVWGARDWRDNAGEAARIVVAAGPLYEPDGRS
jgi:hypothetical protein